MRLSTEDLPSLSTLENSCSEGDRQEDSAAVGLLRGHIDWGISSAWGSERHRAGELGCVFGISSCFCFCLFVLGERGKGKFPEGTVCAKTQGQEEEEDVFPPAKTVVEPGTEARQCVRVPIHPPVSSGRGGGGCLWAFCREEDLPGGVSSGHQKLRPSSLLRILFCVLEMDMKGLGIDSDSKIPVRRTRTWIQIPRTHLESQAWQYTPAAPVFSECLCVCLHKRMCIWFSERSCLRK